MKTISTFYTLCVLCIPAIAGTWTEKNSPFLPQPASSFCEARNETNLFATPGRLFITDGYQETAFNYNYFSEMHQFDASTNRWSAETSPSFAMRSGAHGFTIGNKGYITGGDDWNNLIHFVDCWEYDDVSQAWTQKASSPNSNMGTMFSSQHYIYSLFYSDSVNSYSTTLYQFEPISNTWTAKSNFPGNARTFVGAFSVGDSSYVVGGSDTAAQPTHFAEVWRYDAVTDSWSQKNNTIRSGRYYFGIQSQSAGYLFTMAMDSLIAYDPVSDSWSVKHWFAGIDQLSQLTFDGQNIYLVNANTEVFRYDEAGDAWIKLYDKPVYMSYSHSVVINQKAYTQDNVYDFLTDTWYKDSTGGALNWVFALGDSAYTDINGFQLYVPSTGTWQTRAPYPGSPMPYVSFSIGNKGYLGISFNVADFWEYDPTIDAWSQKAMYPGGGRESPAGFSIGQKGYVYSGWEQTAAQSIDDLYEYDPVTNTWTQKSSIGAYGRVYCAAAGGTQRGYVGFGSEIASSGFNDVYEYNPTTDQWIQLTSPSGSSERRGPFSFVINDNFFFGGGTYKVGSMGGSQYSLFDFFGYDPGLSADIKEAGHEKFIVFPTVTNDYISLEGIDKSMEFEIYSSAGKLMKKIFIDKVSNIVDVREFAAGVYYLKPNGKKEVSKFVKE